MALTKHLHECIKHLILGRWFEPSELPSPIHRNDWVCKRLEEEGILEFKSEWMVDNDKGMKDRTDFRTVAYYRVIEDTVKKGMFYLEANNPPQVKGESNK